MFDHLYLDAQSLVYRAYFALPTTLTDDSGRPVNAVRGFTDVVASLVADHRPNVLAAQDYLAAMEVGGHAAA